MAHTKAVSTPLATLFATLLAWGTFGCTDAEPCDERPSTQSCTCSGGAPGEQVCLPEMVWGECVCDGGPDASVQAGHGGSGGASGGGGGAGAGGAGAGSGSGGAGAGSGGHGAGSGGAGGTGTGGTGAGGDGGGDPSVDAGLDGGLLAGTGGAGGAGGGGGAAADAYRTCTMDADCGAGSSCVTLSVGFPLPANMKTCSPDCDEPGSCPKPAGNYEAEAACVSGGCLLECTAPDPFSEPLSCPGGFSCQDEPAGSSYCLH